MIMSETYQSPGVVGLQNFGIKVHALGRQIGGTLFQPFFLFFFLHARFIILVSIQMVV